MRSIAETPQHERYLMVAQRVSPDGWRSICESVRDHAAKSPDREAGRDSLRLIEPCLTPTSFPFVVLFSYADIPAHTAWNAAFDPTNLSSFEPTTAVLQFGVIWQRIAQPALEHGHHQIAVIDFPNGIPSLLDSLPFDTTRPSYGYIGLCHFKDLPTIQSQHGIVAEHSRESEHSITRQLRS